MLWKNLWSWPGLGQKWNIGLHTIKKFARGNSKRYSGKFLFLEEKSLFSTMCNTVNALLCSSHRGVHVNGGSGTLEEQVVQ